jgi:hypothetical protein
MHRAWLALLVAAALVMWVGVPAGWLWIGSQIQGATGNLGAAMGAMLLGSIASITAMAFLLARITRAYQDARVARGLEDTGSFPLEVTLVCTAVAVGGAFVVWFFGFSGGQPFPLFPG